MELQEAMQILKEDMKVAVFATVDAQGHPHARHAHIGVANEQGVFFMTSPKTKFYQQLKDNPYVAISALSEKDYLIQVIRIEGEVRELGKEKLAELLAGNPYVDQVYPSLEDQAGIHVFQVFQGELFYRSLTQGHQYTFKFGQSL
ncbi:pyridoxamine 5'-phosphate oxidase family protein [Facklamia languida]